MLINLSKTFEYRDGDQFLPPFNGESTIQTVEAELFLKVGEDGLPLEGLCFDRNGDLYFVDVYKDIVCKLDMLTKEIEIVYYSKGLRPAAVKIHKDGRLFICGIGNLHSTGSVIAIPPDGSGEETIIPRTAGYVVDDMVFDKKGGFYFTDLRGTPSNPIGGVYYVSSSFQEITPIVKHLAGPNGISLSSDETILWVTETNANRLHHIRLDSDGISILPNGHSIPYYFTGFHGPDSCCLDEDGNLYVAMTKQGRVLIFNRNGFPIGQILIPGRQFGQMLHSTHPAFIPNSNQLIICTSDGATGKEGKALFVSKGFANGQLGYQLSE